MAEEEESKKSHTYQDLVDATGGELDEAAKYDWLHVAITTLRDVGLLKDLISKGACVNIPENNPKRFVCSPLMQCVECDFVEGVSVLVEGGAEVDFRSPLCPYKVTPLHRAVQEDNLPIVKELMSYGADPYRLVKGFNGKPFSWDCFDLAEFVDSDGMKSYLREYKLFEEEKLKLTHLYWREQPDVLRRLGWPTAVNLNEKIFVGERWWGRPYDQFLYVFNVVSRKWSEVPFPDSRVMCGFTFATTANQVHTLGGVWRKDGEEEECSKVVFSLDDNMKWSNILPPLNIGRVCATSTSFEDMIVVAGGWCGNESVSSVEVLDSSQPSSTWWEICDLPVKSWFMQCTVTDDELFIGCGYDTDNTVYTAKLSAEKESLIPSDPKSSISPKSLWQSLPKTPLKWSGLVAVNSYLVTVGGWDDASKRHSSVYLYDCYKKTWTKVSDIRKSRDFPAVVVCTFENKQELFVLCGRGAHTSVESCELF